MQIDYLCDRLHNNLCKTRSALQIMKDDMQNGLCWEKLSMEQLSKIADLQRSLTMPVEAP